MNKSAARGSLFFKKKYARTRGAFRELGRSLGLALEKKRPPEDGLPYFYLSTRIGKTVFA
jgi:hypothetical protein